MREEEGSVKVWWCEEHGGPKFKGYPWCQRAADSSRREQLPPCRMVEQRLVPADALVIEKVEGEWPEWITDVDGPVWYQCGGTDDLLQVIFDAVAARASQVGEPGT